jgi:lipid-binding SYLF domain-containing protein
MKTRGLVLQFALALGFALLPGAPYAQDQKGYNAAEYRAQLKKEVPETIAAYKKADPAIDRFFKNAAGYAVFPRIGKAGFIIGGGQGGAEVYGKGNKLMGTATMTIVTVGLQAGAQEFSEIIFFETQAALDRFTQGKFEFAASASAVIITAGAAKSKEYTDGVAVFVQPRGGAMAEAALGTQKFSFKAEGGDSMKK